MEWSPSGYYYDVYDAVAIGAKVRLQIMPETDRYKYVIEPLPIGSNTDKIKEFYCKLLYKTVW